MKNNFAFNERTKKLPLILGIDTSCDETSASVILGRVVLSNIIASQAELHREYGGVYPTLAKQAHLEKIVPVINLAMRRAGVVFTELDAIAVTLGPGLAPALEIGIAQAQQLAEKWQKPLIAVNHLEAHLLSVLLQRKNRKLNIKKLLVERGGQPDISINFTEKPASTGSSEFPILGMIFSGGHSQFVQINNFGSYQVLGETIDDAVGEALDKVGRMLGLGYPAAPVMEILAKQGDPGKFEFPLPMTTTNDFNLSYSGLKTAAHRLIKQLEAEEKLTPQVVYNFSASFQQAVFRHLVYKLSKLMESKTEENLNKNQTGFSQAWLGGGVAANITLRRMIRRTLKPHNIKLKLPFEKRLCGDNAAMIALTAGYKINYACQDQLKAEFNNLDRQPSWKINVVK